MASAEEFKQQQKAQWNAAAPGWDAWARWYETNFNPLTDWLCRATGVRPGLAVLDIASGTGEPALEAAARVRPGGKVVGIDISPQMLTAARRRAAPSTPRPRWTRTHPAPSGSARRARWSR